MVSNVTGAHQVASGLNLKFDPHTLHTGRRIKVRIKVHIKVWAVGAGAQLQPLGV